MLRKLLHSFDIKLLSIISVDFSHKHHVMIADQVPFALFGTAIIIKGIWISSIDYLTCCSNKMRCEIMLHYLPLLLLGLQQLQNKRILQFPYIHNQSSFVILLSLNQCRLVLKPRFFSCSSFFVPFT